MAEVEKDERSGNGTRPDHMWPLTKGLCDGLFKGRRVVAYLRSPRTVSVRLDEQLNIFNSNCDAYEQANHSNLD